MSRITNDIIKSLRKSLQANDRKTSAYDTQATIRRIEGNTAWVHIPGGVDETPVQLTINASEGDTVQVRVSGGRAFLVGNATAPPTDNTYARQVNRNLTQEIQTTNTVVKGVQKVVQAVKKIADNTNQYFWHTETGTDTGAHITEIPQEEFLEDPANGGGNLLARSNGIAVRDGLEELATFSADGVQIGKDGEANSRMDYHSFRTVDKEGDTFFNVQDLRDRNGVYQKTDTYIQGYYEEASFDLTYTATSDAYTVTVLDANDNDITSHFNILKTNTLFVFEPDGQEMKPASGCTIIAVYETADEQAKVLTFGKDSNGDPTFNVDGDGSVNTVNTYKRNGLEWIKHWQFDLGRISITSGTPGTTSEVITVDLDYDLIGGYIPLSVNIQYVNASIIGFNAFFNSNYTKLYVQVIRRTTNAASPGYNAYADVTFIKAS